MRRHLLAAVAALVAIAILPMAPARADGPSDESSFVAQINGLRATKGLPALTVEAGLANKARAWAQTMADKNTIWHSSLSDGITADWHTLGENVGMGGTVDGLHIAFVNSPHHYDNLVDPTFTFIGVGVVRAPNGTLFVAEEFMSTRAPSVSLTQSVAAVAPAVKAPAIKKATKKAAPAKRKTKLKTRRPLRARPAVSRTTREHIVSS